MPYPAGTLEEAEGSREITITRDGATATRIFRCNWSEHKTLMPGIDSAYPGETTLKCNQVRVKPLGKTKNGVAGYEYDYAEITADYSTYQAIDEAPTTGWEAAGEYLTLGAGGTWADNGMPCLIERTKYVPNTIVTHTVVSASLPDVSLRGHINMYAFSGCAPETLLYEGAAIDNRPDYQRGCYIYTIKHKFLWRPISQNLIWRAPQRIFDAEGYDVLDANGHPTFVEGDSGAWTYNTAGNLYELADFSYLGL